MYYGDIEAKYVRIKTIMIRFFIKERISEMEFREKRRITLEEVAKETGISRNTLSRITNTWGYSTTTDILDRLCKYFDCSLDDIAQYVGDDE